MYATPDIDTTNLLSAWAFGGSEPKGEGATSIRTFHGNCQVAVDERLISSAQFPAFTSRTPVEDPDLSSHQLRAEQQMAVVPAAPVDLQSDNGQMAALIPHSTGIMKLREDLLLQGLDLAPEALDAWVEFIIDALLILLDALTGL